MSSAFACLGVCRAGGIGQRLLLRWAEQQWSGMRHTLTGATAALAELKAAAAKLAMGQHAKRFLLEVDTVVLALLQVRCSHLACQLSHDKVLLHVF